MAKKTKTQKIVQIKKIVKKLLDQLEVKTEIEITSDEDIYQVQLETEDPGILIGYHGETLRAIQKMVAMINYRQLGEWQRIIVNVGDYRQRRQNSLEKMALAAAQKARFSQKPQPLPPMSSAERRIIHLALTDQIDIETVSEGEGRIRHVVIRPKA